MFSTSNSSKVTPVFMVVMMIMMMMMMMMTEAAAVPKAGGHSKHPGKTHKKSSDSAAVETVPLQLNPSVLVDTKVIRPLQNDSISPWTYDYSHDDSLYPSKLAVARCLLQGCLNLDGQEDMNLQSRPIMHQVQVLRRVRSAGAGSGTTNTTGHGYHYQLEYRLIAVGCTCVRPSVQQQQ